MPVRATSVKISIATSAESPADYLVILSHNSKEIDRVLIPKAPFLAGGDVHSEISEILQKPSAHYKDILRAGEKLCKNILTGGVGEKWHEFYRKIQDDYKEWRRNPAKPLPLLRTYLHLSEPELEPLPWESLVDAPELESPIFFDPASTLIRAHRARLLPLSEKQIWPIVVLVVVGAEKSEIEQLKVADEVHAITQAFRQASHSFLVHTFYAHKLDGGYINAAKAEIAKYRPQILHFIGHAGAEPAALRVGDELWSATNLQQWLKTQKTCLRLAYLNACRTQVEALALPSVARAFLNAGTLSTIAMQAEIRGEEASRCAFVFYDQVVLGHSIDVAISQARIELSPQTRDAYLPALTVEVDPDLILPGSYASHPDERVIHIGEIRHLCHFVNRSFERREMLMGLFAAPLPKDRYNVVALCGGTDFGKTGLAYWCLRALAWQNHVVVYVDVRGHKNYASLLRSIVEGDLNDVLRPVMPEEKFAAFLKMFPPDALADDVKDIKWLSECFQGGLLAVAGQDRTVILCLDEWKRVESEGDPLTLLPTVVKHLLNPIARGDGRIKAIVSASSEQLLQDLPDPPDGSWKFIRIPLFDGRDYPDLLREWFGARFPDYTEIESLSAPRQEPMTPKAFLKLCSAIAFAKGIER